MMEEEGVVVSLENEFAVIHAERGSSCEGCSSKSTCHSLSGTDNKIMEMKARNEIGAVVGDRVKVAIDSIVFLKSSFLVYIVPLIFMITGGVAGESYAKNHMPGSDPDLVAGGSGVICLIISFLLIKVWSKRLENKKEYQPVISAIINH